MQTQRQRIQVEIPTQPEFVRLVRLVIAGIGNTLKFNVEEIEDLKLAVGEACYQVLQSTPVGGSRLRITASPREDGVEVELSTAHGEGDESGLYAFPGLELTDRRLGLTLMKQVVDEISFTANSETTSLRLFKRRRSAAPVTKPTAGVSLLGGAS